jgi:hypothetical protein
MSCSCPEFDKHKSGRSTQSTASALENYVLFWILQAVPDSVLVEAFYWPKGAFLPSTWLPLALASVQACWHPSALHPSAICLASFWLLPAFCLALESFCLSAFLLACFFLVPARSASTRFARLHFIRKKHQLSHPLTPSLPAGCR